MVDIIGYGFGGPIIDNVTCNGGADSVGVMNGSIYFADYIKKPNESWKGCHKIDFKRYVYRKNEKNILRGKYGYFILHSQATTSKEYTQDVACKDICNWIIIGESALLDKGIPISFLTPIKDKSILYVKDKWKRDWF